jgi:hypothetical protein
VNFSLIELLRSYKPSKLRDRRHRRNAPKLHSSNPDDAWRECLDRDLYGANTGDYSLKSGRSASRQPGSNGH